LRELKRKTKTMTMQMRRKTMTSPLMKQTTLAEYGTPRAGV
jgi:hypothetical protein